MAERGQRWRPPCSGSRAPRYCPAYLSNFANYSATYGSLGAAIGLMMWMWMSAIIVLCGAELNSEIERQIALEAADIATSRGRSAARGGSVAAGTRAAAVSWPWR